MRYTAAAVVDSNPSNARGSRNSAAKNKLYILTTNYEKDTYYPDGSGRCGFG